MNVAAPHLPVMPKEVIAALAAADRKTVVDATFGGGGHSRALLDASSARIFGIDCDPTAVEIGKALERESAGRFTMLEGRFSQLQQMLFAAGVEAIDGALIDAGVSSMQLDRPERGFSFMHDGPLDMRMSGDGESAADFLNDASRDEIEAVLRRYGEEPRARRIAKAIVERRRAEPFGRTAELADLVRRTIGGGRPGHHPATRAFQAIRIHVNRELEELTAALAAFERLLCAGGRLAVLTFHSLEDAVVKRFLALRSGRMSMDRGSRHRPERPRRDPGAPSFKLLFKKPKTAGAEEISANPRARSAKLRAAERNDAAPWPEGAAI